MSYPIIYQNRSIISLWKDYLKKTNFKDISQRLAYSTFISIYIFSAGITKEYFSISDFLKY